MIRLPIISASQLETHVSVCPRKRFIKSVLKVKEPQRPGGAVGDAVHRIAEDWINDGTEPRGDQMIEYKHEKTGYTIRKFPGQIFMNGRHLVPRPGTAVAEGLFKARTAVAEWWGARDWVRRADSPNGILLGDNKTTSNPIYANNSVDLSADIQANVYAFDLLTNSASQRAVGLDRTPECVPARWVYFLTEEQVNAPRRAPWITPEMHQKWDSWVAAGRPVAWAVEHTFWPEKVVARIKEIDAQAAEMLQLAEQANGDPHKIPANLDGCDAYGGCAYRGTEHCRLSTADVYDRVYGQKEMSVDPLQAALAKVKQLQDAMASQHPGAVIPPPVAVSAPAVMPWAYGDPLNDAQEFLAKQGKALFVVAMAADLAPSAESALSWPGAKDAFVAYPAGMTPVGRPEAGTINPPVGQGGQTQAARNPEEHQRQYEAHQATLPPPVGVAPPPVADGDPGDDKALRARLKAEAIRVGATHEGRPITDGYRGGVKSLQAALDAHWARSAPATPTPAVPATPIAAGEDERIVRLAVARMIALLQAGL